MIGGAARPALVVVFSRLRPQWRAVLVAVLLSVVTALAFLAQPWLVTQVIGAVRTGAAIGRPVALVTALLVVAGLAAVGHQFLLTQAAESVARDVRRDLVAHTLRLPIEELDRRRVADLVSRVGSDTTVLRTALTQGLTSAAGGLVLFLGALIGMISTDPVLLVITLSLIVISTAAVLAISTRVERASAEAQARLGALSAALDRSVRALRTIRAANAVQREERSMAGDVDAAWRAGVEAGRYVAVIVPVSTVTIQLSVLAVLGVGGYRVATGRLEVGDLVAFLLYSFMLIMPLNQGFAAAAAVASGLGALRRITEILALPRAEEVASARPVHEPESAAREVAIGFRDVCFGYGHGGSGHEDEALHAVSFDIRRGARVALVGPSGAGKSTVLSLIERFYAPQRGQILLDGFDLRELDLELVRARIGYVEQSAPVLAGSLGDNLRLAAPLADDAECLRWLRAVRLDHLVHRSPAGLAAEVGESGITLSGGERQRLALARALIARPSILLLDESTSSLDGRNEQLVAEAIATAAVGCTVLVVAHRLATVIDSDEIVVLDGGRVVARGRHSELIDHSPLYRELAQRQLRL